MAEHTSPRAEVYNTLYKALFIGNARVGKHAITQTLSNSPVKTPETQHARGKISFKTTFVQRDERKYKIQLWDTTGQEQLGGVSPVFLRGANVIFLVYDISNRDSFESIEKWNADTKKHECLRILVAVNKHLANRVISIEEGQQLAASLQIPVFEIDLTDKQSIQQILNNAVEILSGK